MFSTRDGVSGSSLSISGFGDEECGSVSEERVGDEEEKIEADGLVCAGLEMDGFMSRW